MRRTKDETKYFFVDESGDTTFYNQNRKLIVGEDGCSKILILGFVSMKNDPKIVRKQLNDLRAEILKDPYLNNVPSVKEKTSIAFHAKNDIPEIRERIYKLIATFNFSSNFIVARKIEKVFIEKHKKDKNLFYDDLIIKLFYNQLHTHNKNKIYFSVRGDSTRQAYLEKAIRTAIYIFETRMNTKVNTTIDILPQTPSGETCLQIIDYVNWAVYQAVVNRNFRYIKYLGNKISYVNDIYDFSKTKPSDKIYSENKKYKDRRSLNKISPL